MINKFKFGQTWKIWPSPLSLSLYCTFNKFHDLLKLFGQQHARRVLSNLQQWLNQQSDREIVFPAGRVKSVFSNNQKGGTTYVITGDNVVPVVMTSHIHITFNPESSL